MSSQCALDWLAGRVATHQAALPEILPEYRALNLYPGEIELSDDRAIAQALHFILAVRPGEIPQRLDFGSRLPLLIDELMTEDNEADIQRESVLALKRWARRATIVEVLLDRLVGGQILRVRWKPVDFDREFETEINLAV